MSQEKIPNDRQENADTRLRKVLKSSQEFLELGLEEFSLFLLRFVVFPALANPFNPRDRSVSEDFVRMGVDLASIVLLVQVLQRLPETTTREYQALIIGFSFLCRTVLSLNTEALQILLDPQDKDKS